MRQVLTINSGSSSLKFAVFRLTERLVQVLTGNVERIGLPGARLAVTDVLKKKREASTIPAPDHVACVPALVEWLERKACVGAVSAIGHRVVHGGPHYHQPQQVDASMLQELRRISPFDPEHLPAEIALIEEFGRRYAQVPQFACFDTAFHRGLPRVAKLLPI